MKYTSWEIPETALATPGLPPLVGRVLAQRGLGDPAAAREFLRSDPGLLHDPFLLRDMDKAVRRLEKALSVGEKFAVYGDYDVDGMTAACLLYDFFTRRGAAVRRYIPRRLTEGYGLNKTALDTLHGEGCTLVVTVDCGITAVDEVAYAKALGMEVIVTDHHTCKETLPEAVAVVDPQRPDCPYPFKGLAGVGVALKLAMAMGCPLETYVDLAALGTVADVMPLTGENRAIVTMGLERMWDRPGLAALLEESGSEPEGMNAASLSFTVCPRLNAAGRLGVTEVAEELLLAESLGEALGPAQELCRLNRERQRLEGEIFDLCAQALDREPAWAAKSAIVLAGEGWHQGVVGIVASRLAERYDKPAFIISLEKGMGKGSCRSAGGVSLFHALEGCAEALEGYGGHDMAAGFTVREENIPLLRDMLDRWVTEHREPGDSRRLQVDCRLEDGDLITLENVASLDMLEPFGAGNPKPVFVLEGCETVALTRVGDQGRHLKLTLRRDGAVLPGIFFSCPPGELTEGELVDVAFTPQINHYRGRDSAQLLVSDLRPAAPEVQGALYEKYRRGERLTAWEARTLIPSRAEFEGVWRYLAAQAPVEVEPPRLVRLRGPEGGARTMVSLEVFEERGLIRVERARGAVTVTLAPRKGKVDLEASPIMRALRRAAEDELAAF